MDNEFNDIEDAMVDLMIDQLHKCAELKWRRQTLTPPGSVAQRIEQLPSKQSVVGSIPT